METIKKLTHAIGLTISNDEKLAFLFHRMAVLYDAENFSEIWSFKVPQYTSNAAISNNNKLLATKNVFGRISLWSIESKKLIKNFPMKRVEGENILFSPDDRYLVDADFNGNIMVINIADLSFQVIKTYDDCMINGISFNEKTAEFIFTFLEKFTIKNMHSERNNKHVVIWKYPFKENNPLQYLLPEEVGRFSPIKKISNSDNYYSYNEKELIILDNRFEIKSRAPLKVDYAFKPVLCSKEGKYIASVKHGINLYCLKSLDFIANYFVKGALGAAFIDGDKKMIVAGRNGSYVLEIEEGDGIVNEME